MVREKQRSEAVMESQSDGNGGVNDTVLSTIKDLRQGLEARAQSQHKAQLELLAALQAQLVPNIVSSLDLSLKVVSSFNNRPFTPTPPLPPPKPNPRKQQPVEPTRPLTPEARASRPLSAEPRPTNPTNQNPRAPPPHSNPVGEQFSPIDESGSPLSVVRSMVAVCLLERVPFSPIDSSTVLRKLENDQSATHSEKAALRELGGESGAILAVEMALRSMAEDNRGVELEEFVVSGKSRVMVLNIDRTQLMKELPESTHFQQQQQESSLGDGGANQSQSQQQVVVTTGVDVNGGVFGMSVPVPRPMPDLWMGPNDPHMSAFPPMFGGNGPPSAMMGLRGAPRGVIGMMGMPRGIGVPPLHRPPTGPNAAIGGPSAMKTRTEEDDMKDLEALLSKKSFRELQKSKTGEELLDLIHRPTAKETATAAKVCEYAALGILQSIF